MKTFDHSAAQGDILIMRIDDLPEDLRESKPVDNQYIVAHSETGHHHAMTAEGVRMYTAANDPMVLFLAVDNEYADLIHNRSFDTHETLRLKQGNYIVRRQREYTPEGWRRIED